MSYRHKNQHSGHHSALIQPSYYDVLGVLSTATDSDIKSAYRQLVMLWHPDRKIHTQELAEQNLKAINEAYSKIKNRAGRDQYNQILRLQRKAAELSHKMPKATMWGKFWNWLTMLESSRK